MGPRSRSRMLRHGGGPSLGRRRLLAGGAALAGATLAGGMAFADGQVESGAAAGRPIRIGQIGVAHAHAEKLAVYRESSDYEVVGIVEPDVHRRQTAAGRPAFQGLPWMSQEELLDVPGLEAVLVETDVRDSLSAAAACIAAGKHVHLDKPAGESLPPFERLLAAADRQGLLVQLGYMYRYNPAVVLLREFVREGWLGEIFEIDAVMSKVVDPDSRRGLARYPGGMMFELGCHLIDLVVGLLGEPESVAAFSRSSSSADGLADNMLAVLRYPRGLATVKSSGLEVEGHARRHLTVCGTGGTFHIQPLDTPAVRVALATPRGGYSAGSHEIPLPAYRRYVADAADMARIIRGEKPAEFRAAHDLAVQRTLLAASGVADAGVPRGQTP